MCPHTEYDADVGYICRYGGRNSNRWYLYKRNK